MHNEYIDVRGVWPMYINGLVAIPLRGKDRSITVEEAREALQPTGDATK